MKMSERQLLEDNLTLAGHTVIEDVEKEVAVMSLLQATSTLKHATPLHSQRHIEVMTKQFLFGTTPQVQEEQPTPSYPIFSPKQQQPQARTHPSLAPSLLPQSL